MFPTNAETVPKSPQTRKRHPPTSQHLPGTLITQLGAPTHLSQPRIANTPRRHRLSAKTLSVPARTAHSTYKRDTQKARVHVRRGRSKQHSQSRKRSSLPTQPAHTKAQLRSSIGNPDWPEILIDTLIAEYGLAPRLTSRPDCLRYLSRLQDGVMPTVGVG
ncbi:Hypothetical predicted protein [Pelobates cultripes]|uniref:Uncharacterized protein n=1 Tax=Pelobates cultripes TaxID=61616 RepID=A0AAD1SWW0_PELCU|nr:Hypothetical predicted protein [Pelobates cultripes]